MGIIIRQSFKTLIVIYVGIAFGFLNTLLLYPLVLTEEQIGLVRTVINATVLFSTVAALGSATVPTMFFPYFKDESAKHHGFLFFLLIVALTGFTLFVVLFLTFRDAIVASYASSPLLIEFSSYLIPLTFLALFYNVFETYCIVQQYPVLPAITRELVNRGTIAIGLVLLLFRILTFDYFIPWLVGGYGVSLLIIVLFLKSKKVLFLQPVPAIVHNSIFPSMMAYSGFVLLGNISGAIITNIDGLLLSAYSGLKSTGIYTISFFIAQIVEVPKRSLSQVLIPLVATANKEGDIAKIDELYKKSSINQFIIGSVLFLCIWTNIEQIFHIIPNGERFLPGKWVVFFIGIGKLFDISAGINAEIIGTSRFYKVDLLFYVLLSVVGILLSIWLIPIYGIVGAAIAQCGALVFFNSSRFLFIWKKYGIQPFTSSTGIMLTIFAVVVFLNSMITEELHPLISIVVRSGLITIFILGISYALKLSEEISAIVKNAMRIIKFYSSGT